MNDAELGVKCTACKHEANIQHYIESHAGICPNCKRELKPEPKPEDGMLCCKCGKPAGPIGFGCMWLCVECDVEFKARLDENNLTQKSEHKEGQAIKHNAGKTEWSLVLDGFKEPLEEIVRVMEYGAKKYERDNWKGELPEPEFYRDAMFRHLLADETIDAESGHKHLAHAACCLLMQMWHEQKGKE